MSGYYLACSCGRQQVVVPAQAGETLVCGCGAKLEVPTLVGLRKLPPVKELEDFEAGPQWSPVQATVFTISLLLTIACLGFTAYAGYRWLSVTGTEDPQFDSVMIDGVIIGPDLDTLPPADIHNRWTLLSRGLPERLPEYDFVKRRQEAASWFWAMVGGVLGTLLACAGMGSSFFLFGREGGGRGR